MTDDEKKAAKQAAIIAFGTLAIKGAVAVGILVGLSRIRVKLEHALTRVEFEPSANGDLLAVEYEANQMKKIRYATPQEVWDYSYNLMNEQLSHFDNQYGD